MDSMTALLCFITAILLCACLELILHGCVKAIGLGSNWVLHDGYLHPKHLFEFAMCYAKQSMGKGNSKN